MSAPARTPSLVFAVLALGATQPVLARSARGRVMDADGRPVAGAKISCLPVLAPERALLNLIRGIDAKAVAETKSGPDGGFALPLDAAAGECLVRVEAEAHSRLEVEAGADATAEELELVLAAPARYSGRVTDESGRPVAGARVLVAAGSEQEDGASSAEARTNESGKFDLAAAPGGEVGLRVFATGFAPWTGQRSAGGPIPTVVLTRGGSAAGTVRDAAGVPVAKAIVRCGDGAAETDSAGNYECAALRVGATRVSVRSPSDPDLAATAEPKIVRGRSTQTDLRLSRRASVSGIVVDERTGRPVAGARVRVFEADLEAAASTDSRGRFRIGGIAPRRHVLSVSKRGYLPTERVAGAGRDGGDSVTIPLKACGAIVGRVVDEKNEGIAGARVARAIAVSPRDMRVGSWSWALPSTFTRGDGSFRLRGLPPGTNSVTAAREGFAPSRRDGIVVRPPQVGSPAVFVLRRGRTARGRVVDRQGDPIAGAEVRVSAKPGAAFATMSYSGQAAFPSKPSAISDRAGSFTVAGLGDGAQKVRVSAAGFAARVFDDMEVGGKAPEEWPAFALSRGAPISGVVKNARGEPVAGASVWTYGGTEEIEDTTQSDAEGRFATDAWPEAANVEMTVQAPGYAAKRQSVTPPAENLGIVLAASATIRGRVQDAETEKPIEVFSIGSHAPRAGGIYMGRARSKKVESPDGSFELSDVYPGRVVVVASAPGYVEGEVGGLEVAEGEVREDVVVSLRKGATVSGRVVDADRREGIPSASVVWERDTEEGGASRRWNLAGTDSSDAPHSATTDDAGRFRFDGVPRQRLDFLARHPDYAETEKFLDASSEDEIEIELTRGGSIAGMVVDASGSPIPSAAVQLDAPGSARTVWAGDEKQTDGSGAFRFEHLGEGRYELTARSTSGRSQPTEAVLTKGQQLDGVRLAIQGGTRILGRVTGLPAGRLGGLHVWASSKGFDAETRTEDGGGFRVEGAPPGSLDLYVSTSATMQGRTVEKAVDVPEGTDELPVEIAFEGESRLSGRVTREGRGVPGAYLWIQPDPRASGPVSTNVMTDPDGGYLAEGLTDGGYQVLARAEGLRASRKVVVSGDTQLDVALGGARLSGRVLDERSGEPLDGAEVRADDGHEERSFGIPAARSDSRGAYEIADLDAGDYQVTASRSGYTSKTQALSIGDDGATLDLRLERGSGQPIHAFDGLTGAALRGLDVVAFAADGSIAHHGMVALDETGRGEIPSLAAGTYSIHVYAQGYAPRSLAANVPGPALEAALTPGGRVEVRSESSASGQVTDASGALYLNSPWQLDGVLNIWSPLTVWDHFAPGAYRFVEGERSWSFTVAEGKTTVLELK